jgi:hypothetical protein
MYVATGFLESIIGLPVVRKSIDTLDTRGFEINY